jgi:hypothetical protein
MFEEGGLYKNSNKTSSEQSKQKKLTNDEIFHEKYGRNDGLFRKH